MSLLKQMLIYRLLRERLVAILKATAGFVARLRLSFVILLPSFSEEVFLKLAAVAGTDLLSQTQTFTIC